MAGEIREITDANFEKEVIESDIPVLVDFWASWCGPCRILAPVIEELAGEYKEKVKVGKLDVDANGTIASRYAIRSIPTILIFKQGEIVERSIGVTSKDDLRKRIDSILQ